MTPTARAPRSHPASLVSFLAFLLAAAMVVVSPTAASSAEVEPGWGRIVVRDAVLRPGCHEYQWRYRLSPPAEEWAVDLVLLGPGRARLASDQLLSESEPRRGTRAFRICSVTTRPGRFVVRAKVTVRDGWDQEVGQLPPERFRLRRP